MRIQNLLPLGAIIASTAIFACSSPTTSTGPSIINSTSTGGAASTSPGAGGGNAGAGGAQGGASSAVGGGSNPAGGVSATQGGSGGSNVGGNGGANTGGAVSTGSATGGKSSTGGANTGTATGGKSSTGGANTGTATGGKSSTGGSGGGNTGGTSTNGGASTGGKSSTGGSGGGNTGGASATGGASTGGASSTDGCKNTDSSTINIDSTGYICGNQWGIKGAWYCYSSDTSSPCNPTGVIPYNSSSKGMCLSGTINSGGYDGVGFKVNSGPPGDSATPGTWDGSKIVGFAITVKAGASGKGTGGSVVGLEYVTPNDLDDNTHKDSPGVTLPGVGSSEITYNVLYSDAVLQDNPNVRRTVDSQNLTDVKLMIPEDGSHSIQYDFCITKVVPLTTAPSPVVPTGTYGPAFTNYKQQAVNGINGYAVQNTPFDTNGLSSTTQVTVTSDGIGFTYKANSGASGNSPAAFPAVISGWGPGEAGIQLMGPYKADKQISALQSITSNWSFTMGSSGDAAYDIWFGPNKAPTTTPAVELMIWIGNNGKQPLGSQTGTAVTGSDGVSRTPHYGQANSTGQQVVSYVPSGSATSVTNFDVLKYVKDAAGKYAGLQSSYYLLGVQTGFEVYSADTWNTTSYNITIQ